MEKVKNKKQSQWVEVFRMLKKNKMAMLGLVILVILILLALFADIIANYDTVVIKQNLVERLMPPTENIGWVLMNLEEIYLQDLSMELEFH